MNQKFGTLRVIKYITHNYQDSIYPIASIFKAIKNVGNIKKYEKESQEEFTKLLKNEKYIMQAKHRKLKSSKFINTLPGYNTPELGKVKLY